MSVKFALNRTYRNPVQKYICKKCGKSCSDSDFPRMRFPKKQVDASVDLRHMCLTLEKTRRFVSKIFGNIVKSASTIWHWCQRFVRRVTETIRGLGELLHADETKLRTYKKVKFFYFWALKCPKTKKIVAYHLSETRRYEEAKRLFWEARRKFPPTYLPEKIRTDSYAGYYRSLMEVFWSGNTTNSSHSNGTATMR